MVTNIIQKYKIFIAIACVLLGFLMVHNQVFCDLSFFQKWYLNVENYFLTLTWEKAISDPVELSKSIGWVSISAIGSLYAFEGIWNARLLGSKFLYNYTPLGHLDDGSGIIKSWFGFRNTAGPLKNVIDTVPYEEIAPLYWARNYVFPYIFINPNKNRTNSIQNETNPVIINNQNNEVPNHVEPQIIERERVVEIIRTITKYVERPVYKDRESLVNLEKKVDSLTRIGNDLLFLQTNNKTRQELIDEINLLREHEKAPTLVLPDLKKFYKSFNLPGVSVENAYSYIPLKLNRLMFKRQQEEVTLSFVDDPGSIFSTVTLSMSSFKESYPHIYATLFYLDNNKGIFDVEPFILFNYTEQRSFLSSSINLDIPNCQISTGQGIFYPLLDKIEEIQLQNLQVVNTAFNALVVELKNKIAQEHRLINVETRNQGVQTAYFDLNETIYDRINSFLEVRDETAFIVASHEGRNLPFNNMQVRSYSNPQGVAEAQAQSTSIEVQTEPTLNENIGGLSVSAVDSNLFQNMAAFFTTVLVGAIAHDFQTIELVARSLLGFIHIPEYNQAFLAATEMSVIDLQMTYNFTLDEARRAYDALDFAKEMRNTGSLPSDLSSTLSDTNNYTDNVSKSGLGWRDYLLIGTSIVVIGGAILYITQSMKTGSYDGNEIQTFSPHVEAWKNAYFDKIRKL